MKSEWGSLSRSIIASNLIAQNFVVIIPVRRVVGGADVLPTVTKTNGNENCKLW